MSNLPKLNCELITCKNRSDWLDLRRQRLHASEASNLFGVGYSSRFDMYQEKVNPPLVASASTGRQRRGLKAEQLVLDECVAEFGGKVYPWPEYTIAAHPEIDYLGATPDALYECKERPGIGNHQVKTWSEFDKGSWREGPPLGIQVQVQHEMLVTGLDWSAVSVAFGFSEVVRFIIDRDERFIEALLKVAEEFWAYVADRVEPPLDESVATEEALARLHPDDNGLVTALPPEAGEIAESLARAKRVSKLAERRIKRCNNQLKSWIGDNTYGVMADGRAFSWKSQDRAEYTVPANSFRVLRAHKALPKGVELPELDFKRTARIRLPRWLKERLVRESGRCRHCKCQLTMQTATMEHVVPLGVGGTNDFNNIDIACASCNTERGDDATLPVPAEVSK